MSYKEQIYQYIKKAYREKNAEKIVYYKNALNCMACCVEFEKFKNSFAYQSWVKDNINNIEEVEKEFNRQFSY